MWGLDYESYERAALEGDYGMTPVELAEEVALLKRKADAFDWLARNEVGVAVCGLGGFSLKYIWRTCPVFQFNNVDGSSSVGFKFTLYETPLKLVEAAMQEENRKKHLQEIAHA